MLNLSPSLSQYLSHLARCILDVSRIIFFFFYHICFMYGGALRLHVIGYLKRYMQLNSAKFGALILWIEGELALGSSKNSF